MKVKGLRDAFAAESQESVINWEQELGVLQVLELSAFCSTMEYSLEEQARRHTKKELSSG